MKKALKIGIIVFVIFVLIVLGIILIQKKRDARPFNVYEFPSTLIVENTTNYNRADTIAMVLGNKILGLDTLNLMIVYIPDIVNSGEMEFYGIVQMLPFKTNQFLILLNRKNMGLSRLKETLSHEFIHIDQYLRGDLILLSDYAIWEGDTIFLDDAEYKERPFEKEAFTNQLIIKRKLEKLLYN